MSLFGAHAYSLEITPRAGVADYSEKDVDELNLNLIKRADEVLFKTRAYGKYRLCLHGGDPFRGKDYCCG